jgi:hypothetical protein
VRVEDLAPHDAGMKERQTLSPLMIASLALNGLSIFSIEPGKSRCSWQLENVSRYPAIDAMRNALDLLQKNRLSRAKH